MAAQPVWAGVRRLNSSQMAVLEVMALIYLCVGAVRRGELPEKAREGG